MSYLPYDAMVFTELGDTQTAITAEVARGFQTHGIADTPQHRDTSLQAQTDSASPFVPQFEGAGGRYTSAAQFPALQRNTVSQSDGTIEVGSFHTYPADHQRWTILANATVDHRTNLVRGAQYGPVATAEELVRANADVGNFHGQNVQLIMPRD